MPEVSEASGFAAPFELVPVESLVDFDKSRLAFVEGLRHPPQAAATTRYRGV